MFLSARLAVVLTAAILSVKGAVVEIDIQSRKPVMDRHVFGAAGSYQEIAGRVRFAIDPTSPANKRIVDIAFAPRNQQGLVEFSADLYMLRPVDLRKGNGTVLFEVPNRGKKGMLATFNRAAASSDFGDGLLMRAGYTLVWLGWQHDLPPAPGMLRIELPAAKGQRGLVRSEYVTRSGTTLIPLGDSAHTPYAPADLSSIVVSVRSDLHAPRTLLGRADWSMVLPGQLSLAKPARAGEIYEVVYPSTDPPVAGIGLAAIRDLISHLKRDHRHAIGFGTSQSAMVLRALLYEGFNQGEDGKRVFDGIFSHVAGGRRSTFHRFTQPSRTAGPLSNASLSTTEQFPFSDSDQVDRASGVREGILSRAVASRVTPKIFHTNSTYEYWGSFGSLIHTSSDGGSDVAPPASSRIYVFAGGQHGPAAFPPKPAGGRNLPNFNDYRWPLRALLKNLHAWVTLDRTPPGSVYPAITGKTLVPVESYAFPAIPGIASPRIPHIPRALDFGPHYRSTGVITKEPPSAGHPYGPLMPQSDLEGNDLGAVRMPELTCAIATYTGWNLRDRRLGLKQHLLANTGSYIPFPRTASERATAGDPRPAIESKFATQADYLNCVRAAAVDLVSKGFLLQSDVAPVVERAAAHWQWRMQPPTLTSSVR